MGGTQLDHGEFNEQPWWFTAFYGGWFGMVFLSSQPRLKQDRLNCEIQ